MMINNRKIIWFQKLGARLIADIFAVILLLCRELIPMSKPVLTIITILAFILPISVDIVCYLSQIKNGATKFDTRLFPNVIYYVLFFPIAFFGTYTKWQFIAEFGRLTVIILLIYFISIVIVLKASVDYSSSKKSDELTINDLVMNLVLYLIILAILLLTYYAISI
jgi:hypothetical protein